MSQISLTEAEQGIVERTARRCAVLVGQMLRAGAPARASRLVDARTLADRLGVSRDTVYAHAAELGGKRVGNSARARIRFDLDRALEAWTSCPHSRGSAVRKPAPREASQETGAT
jgi:hypothetical protein